MSVAFPRITITMADKSDVDSSGDVTALCLGFGIHNAWMFAILFGAAPIFGAPVAASPFGGDTSTVSVAFSATTVAFMLFLFFMSFTNQLFLRFYVSKKALILAGTVLCLGSLGLFAISNQSVESHALAAIAGSAVGIGSALTLLLWGTAYARYEFPTIILNTILATILGVAFYMILLHLIPFPLSGILTALLPPLEALILWQLTPVPYFMRREIPIFHPLSVRRVSFGLRFALPVLIFGIIWGAFNQRAIQEILPSTSLTTQLLIGAAAVMALVCVLFAMYMAKQEGHWDQLFRFLMPFVGLGLVALSTPAGDENLLANFFVIVAFISLQTLMWVLCTDLSQEFRLSPIFVVGLGQGILVLGQLLGALGATNLVPQIMESHSPEWSSMLLLLLAICAYAFLPRQREIAQLVSAPVILPDKPSEAHQTAILQEKVSAAKAAAEKDADATLNDAEETTETDETAPGEQAERETPAVLDIDMPKASNPADKEKREKEKGRFHSKCEVIADTYLLSRRETEVMFLLAKGHNAAFIQDKLCISRSTAKTHINHIYRKLDIHTQQELLRMIDEIER